MTLYSSTTKLYSCCNTHPHSKHGATNTAATYAHGLLLGNSAIHEVGVRAPESAQFTETDQNRTITALTLGTSILVYTRLFNLLWIVFDPSFLWMFPPQIWRPFTCFMLTGRGINIIFDTYFCKLCLPWRQLALC